MSVAYQPEAEPEGYACSGCFEIRTAAQWGAITRKKGYCLRCRSLYQKATRQARKEGRPIGEWRPWELSVSDATEARIVAMVAVSREQMLEDVFRQIFEAEGFTALEHKITKARERLAKRNRSALASEGWIS